jgi:molybdopterin-synthase adenylyltransferase
VKATLKQCVRERRGAELVVIVDPREAVTLADPDGAVEALLDELSRAPRAVPELVTALSLRGHLVGEADLTSSLAALDSLGLVEDGEQLSLSDADLDDRHTSNLNFFSIYAGLDRPRAQFVRRLREAHVVVLGVGGAGSSLVMCLAGLGIGHLTLVDRDDVEPRNLARQFLYRHADLGRSKVERAAEWVREFDPGIDVRAVDRWVSSAADLTDLLDGADLVSGGLDGHPDAPLWVNDAAVRAGVPLVVGGMLRSELVYYSVDPGRSPCRRCDEVSLAGAEPDTVAAIGRRGFRAEEPVNGLTGILAMHIGSHIAGEALRYLTGIEPPRAAGSYVRIDLRNGMVPVWEPFAADPDCPVCPLVPGGRRAAPIP